MDVLGAILEKVEGRDLGAVMTEYVTAPLHLGSIGFDLTAGQADLLATPYADQKPAPLRIPDSGQRVHFPDGIPVYAGLAGINLVPARIFDRASFRSSGAGMVGTAGDMLTFIEAIRTGGGRILSRESAAAMMTVQSDLPIPSRTRWPSASRFDSPSDGRAEPQSPGTLGGVWGTPGSLIQRGGSA